MIDVTIDDVTVVAFGKQKKESVIGAITTVQPADLKISSSNLTTALAGRISGVISYQRSGEPGKDNAEFFIRGVTTFGYKKSPLILIDGIEARATSFNSIDVNIIERVEVVQGAAAASLYGAQGANGVIQIFSKKGKRGATQINVSSSYAVNELLNVRVHWTIVVFV